MLSREQTSGSAGRPAAGSRDDPALQERGVVIVKHGGGATVNETDAEGRRAALDHHERIGGHAGRASKPVVADTWIESALVLLLSGPSSEHHLYAIDADARQVFAWMVAGDGELAPLGAFEGLPRRSPA